MPIPMLGMNKVRTLITLITVASGLWRLRVKIRQRRNLLLDQVIYQPVEKLVACFGFHYTSRELKSLFHNLPAEVQINIFSRLPVVDIMRSRVVCTDWKRVISSSSNSADSSRLSNLLSNLLHVFWMQNRPRERWLFLHINSVFRENLLYDIQNKVCYKWRPSSDINRIGPLHIWNTTTNGLLFLNDVMCEGPPLVGIRRVWACNPLTGYLTKLLEIRGEPLLVIAMVAHDDSTNSSIPHYKIVLIDMLSNPPDEGHFKLNVRLYSSKDKRWQIVQSIRLAFYKDVVEVKRFYQHDMIYLLIHNHISDREWSCVIQWFDFREHVWNSCPISRPHDFSPVYEIEYFYFFERNGHLILVVALPSKGTLPVQIRVYKSSSAIRSGMTFHWTMLGALEPHPFIPIRSTDPNYRLGVWVDLEIFPFPDEVEGDKLIMLLLGMKSYAVVCFNFENPPEHAWDVRSSEGDMRDRKKRSPLEEKICTWSMPAIAEFLSRNAYRPYIIESGSRKGFTFEPRLDDVQAQL